MTTSEGGPAKPASDPDQDEQKAKFRAALDKKHGTSGANATSHTPGSSAVPASNDKRMRQFRRKSGG